MTLKLAYGPSPWDIKEVMPLDDCGSDVGLWMYDNMTKSNDPVKKYVEMYKEEFGYRKVIQRQLKL